MVFVGMVSKFFYVRRFQKVLRDWVINFGFFNQSLIFLFVSSIFIYKLFEGFSTWLGIICSSYERNSNVRDSYLKFFKCVVVFCVQSLVQGKLDAGSLALQVVGEFRFWQSYYVIESEYSFSSVDLGFFAFSKESSEALDAVVAFSVVECVERMVFTFFKSDLSEVKELLKINKKLVKMIGYIFEMSDDDSYKEEEIRKYSVIYGRFDSKRKDGKYFIFYEVGSLFWFSQASGVLCV